MARPKGFTQSAESNEQASRAHAFRNALVDAGQEVLAATAAGDREAIVLAARRQLRAVRREFRGEPLLFRILPPPRDEG